MNEIVNKFLSAGDKFMPEIHLRQPGITCSIFLSFTKNKERIPKFKERWYSKYIYQNELDKSCFQHDMACGYLKDYIEEQFVIKYYVIKDLILLKIRNKMNIIVVLFQWFTHFLIKSLLVVLLHQETKSTPLKLS